MWIIKCVILVLICLLQLQLNFAQLSHHSQTVSTAVTSFHHHIVLMENGAQFVIIYGIMMMLKQCVDNLDIQKLVSQLMYYYEHFFVFEADIFHVTIYCSQITIIKLLVHMITYTKYGLRGLFPIDVINPNLVKVISHLKDTNQRCHIMCLLYIYFTMILLYGIIARSNVNLYW